MEFMSHKFSLKLSISTKSSGLSGELNASYTLALAFSPRTAFEKRLFIELKFNQRNECQKKPAQLNGTVFAFSAWNSLIATPINSNR